MIRTGVYCLRSHDKHLVVLVLSQRKSLLYVLNFGMVGKKILVKKKYPLVWPEFWCGREQNSGEKTTSSCMSWILVWSGTKFWWKRKTLLFVLNFGMVRNKILVKKKDPPVCPEFWYGREEHAGEKEGPPCIVLIFVSSRSTLLWNRKSLLFVLNFGMVGNEFLVKKKDPPVCP